MSESLDITAQDAHIWKVPPRDAISRIDRKRLQRSNAAKQRFLTRLRTKFEDADSDKVGSITLKQWMKSGIQNVIQDGHVSAEEFETLFKKIDANSEGRITWTRLVQYLVKDASIVQRSTTNESAHFIDKIKTATPGKTHVHRDMISTILISSRTNEYITISTDSVRLWKIGDLTFTRMINEGVKYVTGAIFDTYQVLALATTQRRLVFYDLQTFTKLPITIDASPSGQAIKHMSIEEANIALNTLDNVLPPLYNMPNCIHVSELELFSDCATFFVGDDRGLIEVFNLSAPKRRSGTDFKCTKFSKLEFHSDGITQISTIKQRSCFASSSIDGKIHLWNYDDYSKTFNIIQSLVSEEPMMAFVYSERQRMIATIGVSRDAYIWSAESSRKIFKLGGHYNVITHLVEYNTTSGDNYILTITNKKEFKLWDAQNYRLIRAFQDGSSMQPENRYSAVIFDDRRKVLIVAANQLNAWGEEVSFSLESESIATHNRAIIGCFYSPEFRDIVTVDTACCIKVHSAETGKLTAIQMTPHKGPSHDVAAACLDISGRRLFTSSYDNTLSLWNYNSGGLLEQMKLDGNLLISTMINGVIDGKDMLARAGWDREVFLYIEVEKGSFELTRRFTGHSDDISCLAMFKNGIISGTFSGELVSFHAVLNKIMAKRTIESGIESVCIIEDEFVIVGDSDGYISMFTLPNLVPVDSFFCQDLAVPVAITAITYDPKTKFLYTADSLGYFKKWMVVIESEEKIRLEKETFGRLHRDEVSSLLIIDNGFIATCGIDNCVRLWSPEFDFVGTLVDDSHWDLNDRSTWVVDKPFETEAKHMKKIRANMSMRFTPFQPDPNMQQQAEIPSFTPLKDSNSPENTSTEHIESEEKEKTLDAFEAIKQMEEFINMERYHPKAHLNKDMENPPPPPPKKLPELSPLSRERELTSQIRQLQQGVASSMSYSMKERKVIMIPTVPSELNFKRSVKMPIPLSYSPLRRKIPKQTASAPPLY